MTRTGDGPCRPLGVGAWILLLGALAASPLACGRAVPPSDHAGRLAATTRELKTYERSWGISEVPRLAEAQDLARNDKITRQPFLYDATINWEERDQKRGWLAVFWLKTTEPDERYFFPQLILEINKDERPRRYDVEQLTAWAVPRGYFWKRQVRFTVVPGEGVTESFDTTGRFVELKIGEQELACEMFLSIHDMDGATTEKMKVRTIEWWNR